MATCEECSFFFKVPENADDFEPGKGDCITEKKDEKGKYWSSKPAIGNSESCLKFKKSIT